MVLFAAYCIMIGLCPGQGVLLFSSSPDAADHRRLKLIVVDYWPHPLLGPGGGDTWGVYCRVHIINSGFWLASVSLD